MKAASIFSSKFQIYFVHIPKNAGTAISELLALKGGGHYNYKQVETQIKRSGKKSFCVVRNPYDRVVSIYEYFRMKKSFWHSSDGSTKYPLVPAHHYISKLTFEEFVDAIINDYNRLLSMRCLHITPQHTFVMNSRGDVGVDFVLKYENLHEELCTLFGQDIKLPIINKSKRRQEDWKQYYTPDTREKIYSFYSRDFELFGYQK